MKTIINFIVKSASWINRILFYVQEKPMLKFLIENYLLDIFDAAQIIISYL